MRWRAFRVSGASPVNNRPPDSPKRDGKDPKNPNTNNQTPGPANNQRIWLVIGGVLLLMFVLTFANRSSGFNAAGSLTLNELADFVSRGEVAQIITTTNGDEVLVVLQGRNQPLQLRKEVMVNLREE